MGVCSLLFKGSRYDDKIDSIVLSCLALPDSVWGHLLHPSHSLREPVSPAWQPDPESPHQHYFLCFWDLHHAAGHLWSQVRRMTLTKSTCSLRRQTSTIRIKKLVPIWSWFKSYKPVLFSISANTASRFNVWVDSRKKMDPMKAAETSL